MNARVSLLTAIVALGVFVPQALAITGGQVDTSNTYSNVGAVVYVGPLTNWEPYVFGSGTLIHPRVLLTAGHVTDRLLQQHAPPYPNTHVSFGNWAGDPDTWHEIEAVITHPNYIRGGSNNPRSPDVGVIILKDPVYDVPQAELAEEGFLDDLKAAGLLRKPGQGGVPFIVAGYGATLDWPPPVITPSDGWRRFADSGYLALVPAYLCLQQTFATGDAGTAYGDSGGPAFWIEPDGTRVLVALTSWGDRECVAMDFYWRVDIPETLDFIDWVIEGL